MESMTATATSGTGAISRDHRADQTAPTVLISGTLSAIISLGGVWITAMASI